MIVATKKQIKNLKKTKKGDNKKEKSKRKKLGYKSLFKISLANYKFVLMDMIFAINGIDKDEYLFSDGFSLEYSFSFNDKFKAMSKLGFDRESKDDINSLKFRARFVTKLLFYLMKHLEDIVYSISDNGDEYNSKWKVRYGVLKEIIFRVNAFTTSYLSNDIQYRNHLEKILEFMLIYTKREESEEIIETYCEQIEFVRRACKTMEYKEDLMINNIIKLAYMMSTENMKLKNCPKPIEDMDWKDYESVREQIAGLGSAILKRRGKEKEHPLYRLFTKAMPLYFSKYPNVNEDYEINVGTKALLYLKFLIDDKDVDKYIDKLVA